MVPTRTSKTQVFAQGVPEHLVRAHIKHLGLSVGFTISPRQADVVIVNAEAAEQLSKEVRPITIIVSDDQPAKGEGVLVAVEGCIVCAPTTLARTIARILNIEVPQPRPKPEAFLDGG